MIGGDVKQALPYYTAFMNDYGMKFRTFKHGDLHEFMSGALLAAHLWRPMRCMSVVRQYIFQSMVDIGLFVLRSWGAFCVACHKQQS
jgi:hypothetical protein